MVFALFALSLAVVALTACVAVATLKYRAATQPWANKPMRQQFMYGQRYSAADLDAIVAAGHSAGDVALAADDLAITHLSDEALLTIAHFMPEYGDGDICFRMAVATALYDRGLLLWEPGEREKYTYCVERVNHDALNLPNGHGSTVRRNLNAHFIDLEKINSTPGYYLQEDLIGRFMNPVLADPAAVAAVAAVQEEIEADEPESEDNQKLGGTPQRAPRDTSLDYCCWAAFLYMSQLRCWLSTWTLGGHPKPAM